MPTVTLSMSEPGSSERCWFASTSNIILRMHQIGHIVSRTSRTCRLGLAALLAAIALISFSPSSVRRTLRNCAAISLNAGGYDEFENSLPFPLFKTDFIGPCFAFHVALLLDLTRTERAEPWVARLGSSNVSMLRTTCEPKGSMINTERVGKSSLFGVQSID